MKLSDIDEMQKVKSEYLSQKKRLDAAVAEGAPGFGSFVIGRSASLDWEIVGAAVVCVAIAAQKDYVDKLVAKLMLYGVDVWDTKS